MHFEVDTTQHRLLNLDDLRTSESDIGADRPLYWDSADCLFGTKVLSRTEIPPMDILPEYQYELLRIQEEQFSLTRCHQQKEKIHRH